MFEAHQGVKWGSSWQRAVLGVWEDTEMKNSGDAPTLSLKNFWNFGLDNILWMPWLVGWFLLGINSKPPSSLWVSIRRRGWDPLHSLCSFILQFNFKQHSRAEEVLHGIAEYESVASVCHCESVASVCQCESVASVCHCESVASVCQCESVASVCHCESVASVCHCERGKCGTRMWLLRWSTRKPLAWPLPISLFADLGLHFFTLTL